jgi:DNA end-binding protein Ku
MVASVAFPAHRDDQGTPGLGHVSITVSGACPSGRPVGLRKLRLAAWYAFHDDCGMAAAVWTGTLSFGLVTIPVKLYPATQPKDVRFHMIDPETGRRVRFRRFVEREDVVPGSPRVTPREEASQEPAASQERSREQPRGRMEEEVAFEDLVRGYEVDEGRFVTLTNQEIEQVRPSRSRSIDLEAFVELEDIDPVFFEKSYYLAPRFGSEKAYLLLLRAMQRAGRAGIGRFVLRTKPHLVAIRPLEDLLGLETLYFADEIRDPKPLASELQGVRITKRESALAEQVIEMLKTDWLPESYADEYRAELLRMIADRSPLVAEESLPSSAAGNVERLMEALKASVEAARRAQAGDSKKARRRRTG